MDLIEEYSKAIKPEEKPKDEVQKIESNELKCPSCGSTSLIATLYYTAVDDHIININGILGERVSSDYLDGIDDIRVRCVDCGMDCDADLQWTPQGEKVTIL